MVPPTEYDNATNATADDDDDFFPFMKVDVV
jgi:hypothetical protein